MIIVYTGDGKGKTTAALGACLRALGYGKKSIVIQFMKGRSDVGEYRAMKEIGKLYKVFQFGRKEFLKKGLITNEDKELARNALDFAIKISKKEKPFILVLDELNVAVHFNLLDINYVLRKLKEIPREVNIIITGRKAKKEIIEIADIASEMKELKHHFRKGVKAVKAIDY